MLDHLAPGTGALGVVRGVVAAVPVLVPLPEQAATTAARASTATTGKARRIRRVNSMPGNASAGG